MGLVPYPPIRRRSCWKGASLPVAVETSHTDARVSNFSIRPHAHLVEPADHAIGRARVRVTLRPRALRYICERPPIRISQ